MSRHEYPVSPFGYRQTLFCPDVRCTQRTGTHGERVEVTRWEGQTFVQVYFGQTVVNAVALPYDTRYDSPEPPRATADHVSAPRAGNQAPLSVDQLIAIATDSRLDIFAPR